ncbi:hypothetical protein [Halorarum salinum]|uniref:Lipoprotein n=1 Tax=Halorarum salinum TaxID=2743089 RepID=A0A7D5LD84_9EURY|nr:hypothetical protein [Halobaculum salinum]QLG63189.1 hypothetical protein HUG12_16200 [Halobaculum salinum]
MKRRSIISTMGAGLVSFAGCIAGGGQSDTDPPKRTDTESPESTDGPADNTTSLTDWERSTDCEGEYDGMYDSVIRVERVTTSLGDEYTPIHFTNLTSEEQTILRPVTEKGGFGTCDASDAFHRFVDRISDTSERQDGDMHVYLDREGTYYGLYVEVQDQVYAY